MYAPAFQLNMHEREAIDKDGHIISGVIVSAFFHILVYDLDEVIVDIILVNEFDVLAFAGVPFKDLDIVILNLLCLGYNIIVLVGYVLIEKLLPLTIREMVVVQFLQLGPEVGDKVSWLSAMILYCAIIMFLVFCYAPFLLKARSLSL